jgi:N-acetylmuramoyl-L-alanine amidase
MAAKQSRTALVNTFAAFGVKSRLAMMFAPRSPNVKKLLYLSFLPFLASFLYAFTITPVYNGQGSVRSFTLVLDAGHGGRQKGAVGIGGVFEKDLNLQLVNAIAAEARRTGIRVVLTHRYVYFFINLNSLLIASNTIRPFAVNVF